MLPYYRTGDGETKADAARVRVARAFNPVERFKDLLTLAPWNTWSLVFDGDDGAIGFGDQAYGTTPAIFHSVADKIGDGASHSRRSAGNRDTPRSGECYRFAGVVGILANSLDERAQIDQRSGLVLRVIRRKAEDGLDHPAHHVEVGEHLLLLVVILDEFRAEPQPRQRCSKIVGHCCNHARTIIVEAAQPFLHPVEGAHRHLLLRRSIATIELNDPEWRAQLGAACEAQGACRLAASASESAALRQAVIRSVATPVDVGVLQFFPVVERVERAESRILVSLTLREQV